MKNKFVILIWLVALVLVSVIASYVWRINTSADTAKRDIVDETIQDKTTTPDLTNVWLDIENLSEISPSRAGDQLHVTARVTILGTDRIATDGDGIAVVVSAYRTGLIGDTISPVETHGLSGEATYNDGVWVFNSSKFPPGKYRYDITAYCQRSDLACGSWHEPSSSLQISNSYYLTIYPPHESQVVSISRGGNLNQSLPLAKPNQLLAFFVANNLIEYTLVAHRAEFHVMFPVTSQELLKNITIVDDGGNIVAGPIDAVGAGYENQLQKIIFSNIKLRPGNHIYYIKGETPNKKTTFSINTTPKDDWLVEFQEVPGTYADLGTSASLFFEEVRVGM